MANLFELGAAATALQDLLLESDLTPEQEAEALALYLNVSVDLEKKVDGYAALIAEFEARADRREAEAKRLAALVGADVARAGRMKDALKVFMQVNGYKRFETDRYRVSLVNNGGKVPLVVQPDVDPSQLDEQYQRVIPAKIELDRDAVRKELESGGDLVFAKLGERGQRISIK